MITNKKKFSSLENLKLACTFTDKTFNKDLDQREIDFFLIEFFNNGKNKHTTHPIKIIIKIKINLIIDLIIVLFWGIF